MINDEVSSVRKSATTFFEKMARMGEMERGGYKQQPLDLYSAALSARALAIPAGHLIKPMDAKSQAQSFFDAMLSWEE